MIELIQCLFGGKTLMLLKIYNNTHLKRPKLLCNLYTF